MSYNSGFTSSFSGSSSLIDILTSISPQSAALSTNMTSSGTTQTYYGRYFCLGNLLIQFVDFSTGIIADSSDHPKNYHMSYPVPYEAGANPYLVTITSVKKENQNMPTDMTLLSYTNTQFTFALNVNNGEISFLVIGPRPSTM